MIDPDYKYPSVVRFNLAYDRDLGFFGLIGTAEFLYSQNVNDVRYENLNLQQVGTRIDGRPFYARNVNTSISDAIFLTNTDQGDSWSIVFKVDRPFRNGLFMGGSYLYGESTAILDGTSSQAASNWGNVYISGDPNNPPNVRSNFDPGHRITLSGGYEIPVPGGITVTASAYYSGQSGPALVGELRQRLQRRRAHDQRPALYPGECLRADHLYQRHVPGPDDVRERRTVSGGLHRQVARAQRLPRALDQHVRRCVSTSACRSSA